MDLTIICLNIPYLEKILKMHNLNGFKYYIPMATSGTLDNFFSPKILFLNKFDNCT